MSASFVRTDRNKGILFLYPLVSCSQAYIRARLVSNADNCHLSTNALLNYMEAMNEYNPEDPKIITYFNEIRERAGIPNITVTYPQDLGDKEKMREWILRERQIELAFEGDRFWTLARRLLYEKEENRKIYRMNVLADDQGQGFAFEGFYERKLLQTRYWDNKMYLYPIAQTEIDRGRGLVQNPGW